MNSAGFIGKVKHFLVACGISLTLLACSSLPAVEAPHAPAGTAGSLVKAAPADLALSRADLPAGFELAAQKITGPQYLAMYLRAAALDARASGGNTLLSVITSVGVYTTTAEAQAVYLSATLGSERQGLADASMISKAATEVVTEQYSGVAQGVDAAQAYRVTYRLSGKRVYEYGHRLRIGNTLAYVVVAALGSPDEPAGLVKASVDLVQRQIDRIVGAAGRDGGSG